MSDKSTTSTAPESGAADPRDEAPRITADWASRAEQRVGDTILREGDPPVRIGRPPKPAAERKQQVTMRFAPDLLEAMRASGPGWQTRAEAVLRREFLEESDRVNIAAEAVSKADDFFERAGREIASWFEEEDPVHGKTLSYRIDEEDRLVVDLHSAGAEEYRGRLGMMTSITDEDLEARMNLAGETLLSGVRPLSPGRAVFAGGELHLEGAVAGRPMDLGTAVIVGQSGRGAGRAKMAARGKPKRGDSDEAGKKR